MEQRKLNKLLKKEIWEFWLQTKLSEVNSVKNSAAAKDIMSVLGMIKRTFSTLNKETFLTLYSTYIKPHLEHCIQVWAPYFNKDIDILEKVQRRATKLVWCTKNLSYEQRLEYLGLYSLSRRRQRGDLIETYKILRNTEDIDYRKFFIRADNVQLRGHNYSTNCTKTDHWNNAECTSSASELWTAGILPQEVIDAPSLEIFKNRLGKFMGSNELGNKSWLDCLLSPWNLMMMMIMKTAAWLSTTNAFDLVDKLTSP